MIKIKKFIILNYRFVIIFFLLTMPALSFSAGLVPDCGTSCNFTNLITMVNQVIEFILEKMVIPIAAIMFAYAGFLFVTAGGEAAGARTKAKSIFTHAVIGLLIAVTATLIINQILSILGYTDASWILF